MIAKPRIKSVDCDRVSVDARGCSAGKALAYAYEYLKWHKDVNAGRFVDGV